MTLDQALERIADLEQEVSYWKAEAESRASLTDVLMIQTKLGVSPQQARLLAELHAHYPKVMAGWSLLDKMPVHWRKDDPSQNFIKVHVSHLRRLLGRDVITTIWHHGYVLGDVWVERISGVLA